MDKHLHSSMFERVFYDFFFRFDNQSDSFRSQSFNMEQATMALQTAKDTQVVVAGMKAGVKEMKKEFKKIDVDKIEARIL